MYKNGRRLLLGQSDKDLEKELFDILRSIYAQAGEKFDDVVMGSRFNRWAHGYAYEQVSLFDSDKITETTTKQMQRKIGNIFMANSDVAWMSYLQNAIEQGLRAAEEAAKV